jgi:hypothetical protein
METAGRVSVHTNAARSVEVAATTRRMPCAPAIFSPTSYSTEASQLCTTHA